MITIYGIKNCDSVKKAIKFFSLHSIPFQFVDFDIQPVTQQQLHQWLKTGDLKTLFNAKSTTFRNLNLSFNELTENEQILWMEKENRLIKRPVVEYGSQIIIGFNQSNYEGTFLS